MKDPFNRPTLRTGLFYPNPVAALNFLETAFGFCRHSIIWDKDNQLVHAEMRFAAAEVVIDGEWIDYVASPINLNGKNSQLIYIHLEKEIDAHCAHAKVSGAEIIDGPSNQFYGDRTYRARDIGGHIWTFSQTIKHVSKDAAEKVSGLKIEGWWNE